MLLHFLVKLGFGGPPTEQVAEFDKKGEHRYLPTPRRRECQQPTNHTCNSFPILRLAPQLLEAATGNRVKPRATIVFRCAPFRRDPILLLKPQQRGVYSALIQLKYFFAHLLDSSGDSVSVQRAQRVQSLQDHQVERALKDNGFLLMIEAVICGHSKGNDNTFPLVHP